MNDFLQERRVPPQHPQAPAIAASRSAAARGMQFSLDTLLLLITLIAICLGISVAAPPLGVAVSLIALAALFRTWMIARQLRAAGVPFPAAEKMAEFVISSMVVVMALAIGLAALFVVGLAGMVTAMTVEASSQALNLQGRQAVMTATLSLCGIAVVGATLGSMIWFLWWTRPNE
jgi:hypothetical protein